MRAETKVELKEMVRHELNFGEAQAIPGKLLAARLDERDTRRIRLSIIQLIVEGIPIIGDAGHGYYIAETREEAQKALKTLHHYLVMTGYHHKYLLRACAKLLKPEQLKLGLEV
ncbi:hypothetical protein LCGC14_1191420 [marine sediment metagenome]|uniref:Uncharacterized protein n=1 Tax=marine sediment metagenome TaxID=412755 RepID=A0A0F9LJA8_9ZZZZ